MKKIVVSLLLLTGISINIQSQSLFNPGFETWSTVSSYNTDTLPNQWWGMFCNTAHQTTDAYQGMYATRLQGYFSCGIAPGILVNGQQPANPYDNIIESGTPFITKPSVIGGYYKYTDVEPGDSAEVTIILKKYNTVTMQRDTVAFGQSLLPATASYSLFTVNVADLIPGIMPDSIIIIFNSSKYGMFNSTTMALPNLYIDRVLLPQTDAGIDELGNTYLQTVVYPNPFTENATISISGDISQYKSLQLLVFNELGQEVERMDAITENTVSLDRKNLGKGNYFYTLRDAKQTLSKGKIIVH